VRVLNSYEKERKEEGIIMSGAFETGIYRNVFAEYGLPEEEIGKRVAAAFQTMFYGSEEERIYHEAGTDMGYLTDTGNNDVRTEGMSYGMMMCVQLDKKEEFDRIWKWSKTYMYMDAEALTNEPHGSRQNEGYFAWSCALDGTKNAWGPAPDGEEFFAMALFFASHRWGDGEGIFNYSAQARRLLHDCIHKGEQPDTGKPMWDPQYHLIKFITECDFSDPSYHLPHFYELFALWADEKDRAFWKQAATASREYLKKACHPVTGLCAEYAEYDGTPVKSQPGQSDRHDWYYSDAYRTIANIGLDYLWFACDPWEKENADRLQTFYYESARDNQDGVFLIDGTPVDKKALHPVAVIATNAQASLASDGKYAKDCVMKLWNTPLRTGNRRYYDNCLYLFALLALSGKYRIW